MSDVAEKNSADLRCCNMLSLVSLYNFGIAWLLKYFLLGSWYLGSKSFNSCWKPDFSTVYMGIISFARQFVTELVRFCHCLPPLSYFFSLENASTMGNCCLWEVDGPAAPRLTGFALAILLDSTGWWSPRCLCRLDVFPPAARTFLMQSLHVGRSLSSSSSPKPKYCQAGEAVVAEETFFDRN